jgi:RNA polymerase sigma-70 factor (ECF subfamily)
LSESSTTLWSLIAGAAGGVAEDREEFARRYQPMIRACLASRWRYSPLHHEIDDAVQEVFVDCFRPGGALQKAEAGRGSGFRGFLFGVIQNVARRVEERRARRRDRESPHASWIDRLPSAEASLSGVFDREWARNLLRQAARVQKMRAKSDAARRRVELLRLRFREGRPIREIAAEWGLDPKIVHADYARGREDFKAALRAVVAELEPPDGVDAECARLLGYLSR